MKTDRGGERGGDLSEIFPKFVTGRERGRVLRVSECRMQNDSEEN